jgi:TIR domain-containing protein
MRVFVSHTHQDNAFCQALVTALRQAGADVWSDEHDLESSQLMLVIQREFGARPAALRPLLHLAMATADEPTPVTETCATRAGHSVLALRWYGTAAYAMTVKSRRIPSA